MPPKRQRGPQIKAAPTPPVRPLLTESDEDDDDDHRHERIQSSEESDYGVRDLRVQETDSDEEDDDFLNNREEYSADERMEVDDDEDDEENGIEVIEGNTLQGTIDYSNLMLEDRVQIMNFANPRSKNAKTISYMVKKIRELIVTAFRTVFQARHNIREELMRSVQKLINALEMATSNRLRTFDMTRYFYNELDARLTQMVEESSVHENRLRCLKMCTLMAMELYDDANDSKRLDFVPFILNFIDVWSSSSNVAGRLNATCFATLMLETGINKYKDKEMPEDRFCGWSSDISARLFLWIKKALCDRESAARIPAIKGLGKLQGLGVPSFWPLEATEETPRELLLRSCRDVHPDCRVTAITTLNQTEEDVAVLCDIVYYDRAVNVRVAALTRFGKLKPQKHTEMKTDLLELCFKDHEMAVRDGAKSVIKDWMVTLSDRFSKTRNPEPVRNREVEAMEDPEDVEIRRTAKGYFLTGQALALLWLGGAGETMEGHANVRRILHHTLDVCRSLYILDVQDSMITFVSRIMDDLRCQLSIGTIPVITKSTIGSIMEDVGELGDANDLTTTRSQVFYWRVVCDYINAHPKSEADKRQALDRFVAPLATMVNHLNRILTAIHKQETDEHDFRDTTKIQEFYVMEMSLVENLLAVFRYCESEQAGKVAYEQLLKSMLMNPFYQKKVYDIIIQELMPFFEKNKSDEEEEERKKKGKEKNKRKDTEEKDPSSLFSWFQAKQGAMVLKYQGEQMPVLEGSVHIGEEKIRNDWAREREEKPGLDEKTQGKQYLDFYYLMIINSLLKTGALKEWCEEYQSRYMPIIRKAYQSSHLDSRVLAAECIGMIGTYNLDFVENEVENMLGNYNNQPEPVKVAVINGCTDCFINDEEKMNIITNKFGTKGDFSQILSNIILNEKDTNEHSDTILNVVQAMARVLLNRKVDLQCEKWECNVISMLYRAAWRTKDRMSSRIRSVIVVFLKFFCSMNIENQQLLLKGYRRFFKIWDQTTTPELLTENKSETIPKLKRCAAMFVALTRHSSLTKAQQKASPPVHFEFIRNIVEQIGQEASDGDYFAYALSHFDFNVFDHEQQHVLYMDITDLLKSFDETETGPRLTELRRASKKLANILGYNEEDGHEPDEMPSQSSTTSRTSTRSARGKRNTSTRGGGGGRGKKGAAAQEMERIDEGDEGGEEEAQEEGEGTGEEEMEEEEAPPPPPPPRFAVKKRVPRDVQALLSGGTSTSTTSTPSTRKRKEEDPLNVLESPTRVQRKPPSRPATGSRRLPTPDRSIPLRQSARRLNK